MSAMTMNPSGAPPLGRGWRGLGPARLAIAAAALVAALALGCAPGDTQGGASAAAGESSGAPALGSAIFIHPDGTSIEHWSAARFARFGPEGRLAWDELAEVAVYTNPMSDHLVSSSHGGATVHAHGRRVPRDSFGIEGEKSVLLRARDAGLLTGLVNSGTITEPGSAVFAAYSADRYDHASIAAQLVDSGVDVLLGGGERWFLPEGVEGVHGPGARADGLNLIERAEELGYAVVRTRDELEALPAGAEKVLGLFAAHHTFNEASEEELDERGLAPYDPKAPTFAELVDVALRVLDREGARFLLVAEEEGSDNLANDNNAAGTIEAVARADAGIAVARSFVAERDDTLLVVAADSDAGGLSILRVAPEDADEPLPERSDIGATIDGREGSGSRPFLAAPDVDGRRLPFAIGWVSTQDVAGAIVVRGEGFRAEEICGTMSASELSHLLARVTLGDEVAAEMAQER